MYAVSHGGICRFSRNRFISMWNYRNNRNFRSLFIIMTIHLSNLVWFCEWDLCEKRSQRVSPLVCHECVEVLKLFLLNLQIRNVAYSEHTLAYMLARYPLIILVRVWEVDIQFDIEFSFCQGFFVRIGSRWIEFLCFNIYCSCCLESNKR